jgi:hypothetical protein
VILYTESSAVLAWLMGESSGERIRELLTDAEAVLASDLTIIECERALLRALALRELTEVEASDRRGHLTTATAGWHVLRIAGEIVDRARQPFPGDPVRTLDAIHLASILVARSAVPDLEVLSLDNRVRTAAQRLGLSVLPRAV